MTYLTHKYGDIFDSTAEVIAHGVNMQGVVGGFAAAIFDKWPELLDPYRDWCKGLGGTDGGSGFIDAGKFGSPEQKPWLFAHLATQIYPGRNACITFVIAALNTLFADIAETGEDFTIALPEIGCGIGGLDIEDVAPVVEALANAHKVHVELWHYVPVDTAAAAVVGSA